MERNLATKTYVSTKTFSTNNNNESNNVFRQPVAPIRRPLFNMDSVKQLNPVSERKIYILKYALFQFACIFMYLTVVTPKAINASSVGATYDTA